METTAEQQGQIVPNFEVEHQHAIIEITRDDEFDFEIGGDENLDSIEQADEANPHPTGQADGLEGHGTDIHVDDSYTHQPPEQAVQASVVDFHDPESHDHGHEMLDLEASALDTLGDTTGFTDAAQDDDQGAHEYYNQEENEEPVEDVPQGEIDYEETTGEFDGVSNVFQPENGQDHDLMDSTTSVEYVSEEADLPEPADETEADQNGTEVDTNIFHEGEYSDRNTNNLDARGEYETQEIDDSEDTSVAADAQNDSTGGDSADATLAQNEPSTEAFDESLDQSNWNADDQEDQTLTARPNVTVSYKGQDYFLFAENSDEDPDTYFLDEVDSIHQPLSQFLEQVRQVISSELETGHEIFMKVDGLGLEFGESTAKDFLDQTTFAQIIDVNSRLVQQDGGSKSPELYIYLSVRSHPLQRFKELVKGADEGQGLSNFEKYYDETSADVSATNDEVQDDFTQEILSDGLSFDETQEEPDEVTGATGDSYDAQQYRNPFRVDDDEQESFVGATISDVVGNEGTEPDTLAVNEKEDDGLDGDANVDAEFTGVEESNTLGLDATDVEGLSFDNALGDAVSVSDQVEVDVADSFGDSHDATGQDVGETGNLEEQTEVQIDFSEETHERTDGKNSFSLQSSDCVAPGPCLCDHCDDPASLGYGCFGEVFSTISPVFTPTGSTIYEQVSNVEWSLFMTDSHMDNKVADRKTQDSTFNAATDDNYLDLGDNGDQAENAYLADATNNDATGYLDTSRALSHSSSASATLDGEDSGHGEDATVVQNPADPIRNLNSNEFDASQPEADEIDWNHDEDDEIGAAAQNPTNLSPSSPSAKRSRQEDEAASGLGEESGMCWVCPIPQMHADLSPAVKRRRV